MDMAGKQDFEKIPEPTTENWLQVVHDVSNFLNEIRWKICDVRHKLMYIASPDSLAIRELDWIVSNLIGKDKLLRKAVHLKIEEDSRNAGESSRSLVEAVMSGKLKLGDSQ